MLCPAVSHRKRGLQRWVWLANCYFAHNSLRFPALLPFFNASSPSRGKHETGGRCSLERGDQSPPIIGKLSGRMYPLCESGFFREFFYADLDPDIEAAMKDALSILGNLRLRFCPIGEHDGVAEKRCKGCQGVRVTITENSLPKPELYQLGTRGA